MGFEKDRVTMPASFDEQAELIWQHVGTILENAGMNYTNLIQLRFYLASPEYDEPNMRIRKKYLGDHEVALTTICSQLLEPSWKLEIEAMAAA
jgi:enamine deaminase RidA (YjgF/YER057c/UK114 family)